MTAALNTPQRIADELLRVDRARRVRIVQATDEARALWIPLDLRRRMLDIALNHLNAATAVGASIDTAVEAAELALSDLQREIDDTLRQVAIRHRLFVNDDATEDFDEVDVDAILPAAEAARRRMRGGRS